MKKLFALVVCLFLGLSLKAQDLSKLYEEVVNGVVVIETRESTLVGQGGQKVEVAVSGLGTGFLVGEDQVMTAAHVAQTAESITVKFKDGEEIPAKVVSSYKYADVALLKLTWPKKDGKILKLGDSDLMKIGEQVFVVGSPLGLTYSFSSGYLSGRQKSNKMSNALVSVEYLQTDAAINKGNSGGPMFNLKGEVVGIVSHILSQSGGFEGIGFATSSNIAGELLYEQSVIWTGIDGMILSGDLADIFNLPQPVGILVQKVVFLSPLGMLGVKGGKYEGTIEGEKVLLGGDVILSVNGVKLGLDEASLDALANVLKSQGDKTPLEVEVYRAGKVITLK